MGLTDTERNIIWKLADEKGSAEWKLADDLGAKAQNLSPILKSMMEDITGGEKDALYLNLLDIKDPISLISKIEKAKDPVSRHIREQMPPELKELMDKNISKLNKRGPFGMSCLLKELNGLLEGPSLFEERRFAGVALSGSTQELICSNPEGEDLLRLNRLLLEEAYPHEIAKSIKPLIYMGSPRKIKREKPVHFEYPYYINRDLRVFQLIVDDTKDELRGYELAIEVMERKHSKRAAQKKRQDASKVVKDTLSDDYDESNLRSKLEEYNDFCRDWDGFLLSEYVSNLIHDFGLRAVIWVMGEMEELKLASIVMKALDKGFITYKVDLELARRVCDAANAKLMEAQEEKEKMLIIYRAWAQTDGRTYL